MPAAPKVKLEELPKGPKRKSGQAITEQEWEKLVVLALRGHTFAALARMTGFNERTVRRFWHEGFKREVWGQTPIKAIVEQEQAKARALRQRIGEDRDDPTPMEEAERIRVEQQLGAASLEERETAKKDALHARTAEAQLVKLARGNVLALAMASVALMKPAKLVATEIGKSIAESVTAGSIKPDQGFALLKQTAALVKDIVATGHEAMEMERLLLGDPSGAGGLAKDAANMSTDEALTELSNASKVFASIERRGLRLVKGGSEPAAANGAPAAGEAFDTSAGHAVSTAANGAATTEEGTSAAGAVVAPGEDPDPNG